MSKFNYLKSAIDSLRRMENDEHVPAECCREFDRFVREQVFGKFKLDLTADEIIDLQNYYIATLEG